MAAVRMVALLLLVGLASCDYLSGPGSRAREFIEREVTTEQPTAAELADGLAPRVSLEYLRALHRQGVALDYTVFQSEPRGEGRVWVTINVSPTVRAESAAVPGTDMRLRLELQRSAGVGWTVVRWWSDD